MRPQTDAAKGQAPFQIADWRSRRPRVRRIRAQGHSPVGSVQGGTGGETAKGARYAKRQRGKWKWQRREAGLATKTRNGQE
jgi:hypothetical protein